MFALKCKVAIALVFVRYCQFRLQPHTPRIKKIKKIKNKNHLIEQVFLYQNQLRKNWALQIIYNLMTIFVQLIGYKLVNSAVFKFTKKNYGLEISHVEG